MPVQMQFTSVAADSVHAPMRIILLRKNYFWQLIMRIFMGEKVYLTVNTLFKERELTEELYSYLLPYYEQGLDAVIIQDMGAFRLVREAFPGLSIHTSTQMTVTNRYGAMMMKELASRPCCDCA